MNFNVFLEMSNFEKKIKAYNKSIWLKFLV